MKKTLALLLVVFTLIAQLSMVTVSADGATVTVENVTAAAGETVEVNVNLAGCDVFTDLSLEFGYDTDVLTLLSRTNGVPDVSPTTAKDIATIPYNVAWNSADPIEFEGTIITLEFAVSADAVAGETYPITVDFYKGRNGNFVDGVNCNFNMDEDFNKTPLNLSYVDGGITIPAPVVPDEPTTPEIPEFVAPSGAYVKVLDYPEFVEPGDVFELTVDLKNCAVFTDLSLEFGYDTEAFTLLKRTNGVPGVSPTTAKDITTVPYNVAWNSADPVEFDGTILTLEFEVNEAAVAGETYDFTVDFYKGRNGNFVDGTNCNFNMDEDFNKTPLNLTYCNGVVSIKGEDTPVVPEEPTTPEIPEFVAPSGAYVKVLDYPEFVEPGDVFELTVDLKNCAVFTDLSLEFVYDTDAFTLLKRTNGVPGVSPTTAKDITTVPYNVAWNSADPVEFDGTIITLEFEVNEAAVTGTYDFTVDFYKGRNGNFVDGTNCNFNMDEDFNKTPLNLTYCNGVVSVKGAAAPVVPTEYKLEATVAGNGVEIAAEGPAMNGKIIAALYNGKDLAQVKIFDAAADLTATFTKSGDKIKVMWWDGMLTAKPLCYSVELPL